MGRIAVPYSVSRDASLMTKLEYAICVSVILVYFRNFRILRVYTQFSHKFQIHTHIQTECPVFYQYYCIVGVLLCICMFATVKGGLTCSSAEKWCLVTIPTWRYQYRQGHDIPRYIVTYKIPWHGASIDDTVRIVPLSNVHALQPWDGEQQSTSTIPFHI